MKKLYIAYGSNLNVQQMKFRCPTARPFAKTVLRNYRLVYRGTLTNAHATVEPYAGREVPVVLWTIEPEDEHNLDIYEGYPRYYFKDHLEVQVGRGFVTGMIYIMNEKRKPGRPSQSYIDIIREGYDDFSIDHEPLDISLYENDTELACARK